MTSNYEKLLQQWIFIVDAKIYGIYIKLNFFTLIRNIKKINVLRHVQNNVKKIEDLLDEFSFKDFISKRSLLNRMESKKKVNYRQAFTSANEEFLLEISSTRRANIRDIKHQSRHLILIIIQEQAGWVKSWW